MTDIGHDSVAALLRQLTDAKRKPREAARTALLSHFWVDGRLSKETPPVIARLAEIVRTPALHGRSRALNLMTELAVDTRRFALGFDPASKGAKQASVGGARATFVAAERELPSLVPMLGDKSPAVRIAAAHFLGYVGARSDPRPLIRSALAVDADLRARVALALALGLLDTALKDGADGSLLHAEWATARDRKGPSADPIYTASLSLPAAMTARSLSRELLESVVDASAFAQQDVVVFPFLEGSLSGLALSVLSSLGCRAAPVVGRLAERLRELDTNEMSPGDRQREKMRVGEVILATGFETFEGRGEDRVTRDELSDAQRAALAVVAEVGAVGDLRSYGLPQNSDGISQLLAVSQEPLAKSITLPLHGKPTQMPCWKGFNLAFDGQVTWQQLLTAMIEGLAPDDLLTAMRDAGLGAFDVPAPSGEMVDGVLSHLGVDPIDPYLTIADSLLQRPSADIRPAAALLVVIPMTRAGREIPARYDVLIKAAINTNARSLATELKDALGPDRVKAVQAQRF